jgi:DnaJ homolog subfamily C member 19
VFHFGERRRKLQSVHIGLLLLVIAILYFVLFGSPRLSSAARQQAYHVALGLGGIAILLLLVRFGMPWLALIGTAAWALVRFIVPIGLRFLPLLLQRRSEPRRASAEARSADAAAEPTVGKLTRRQALDVLGLREEATKDEIVRAYRELIKRVHPDRGGSAHLAAEVNRARDVLLAENEGGAKPDRRD